jgi:hypothetical protein
MASQYDTVSTQYVKESPEVEAYKLGLLEEGNRLYQQGLTLPTKETAGLSDTQLQSIDLAKQATGIYQPYMDAASAGVSRGQELAEAGAAGIASLDVGQAYQPATGAMASGLEALQGTTGMYDPSQNVKAFMDPYQQQVIDQATAQIDQQYAQAQNEQAARAAQAGAFGSTREGVERAILAGQGMQEKNKVIADLLSSGYQNAVTQAGDAFENQQKRAQDQANIYGSLGEGIGNLAQSSIDQSMKQGTTLADIGSAQANMAGMQGDIGANLSALYQGDVSTLSQAGALEQGNLQQQLDTNYENAYQAAVTPYEQLAYVSDIYKNAPSSQMQLLTSGEADPSTAQQVIGTATGVATGVAGADKLGIL